MSYIEDLNNMSYMKKTPSPFNKYRRHRPLEDISNLDSPMLPNIREEDSNGVSIETTPRRRVIRSQHMTKELKTPDSQPTSSTPLSSRRQPTPKVQRPVPHNPFEADLINRLHLPICSPNVFNTVVSPTKSLDGENFDWPIEDVSRIKPAAIEEFPEAQFTCVEDPEVESRAQQTLDTFWKSEKHIIPSPWQESRRSISQKIVIQPKAKSSSTVASQTTLSLPPVLPMELEEALKPYFNKDDEDSQEEFSDEEEPLFLSQSGLRRKLMFMQEEVLETNCPSSPIVSVSSNRGISRTDKPSNLLRSPTISPIKTDRQPGSPAVDDTHCSQMSVDLSTHSNGRHLSVQLNEEYVSHSGWSLQRQVLYEDQTMDSVAHNIQASHHGQTTDQGYATETSSLNFANHFHSRLPDYTLPGEPWVPHLGCSTPSDQNRLC